MDLIDFNKSLRSINVDQLLSRAVLDNKEEIVDSNTAQLSKGRDSLGNFLDKYASDDYAQFKKAIGSEAPFGIPNLKLEGDFYSGFVLSADGKDFRLDSTDEKRDKLVNLYGTEIFGLSESSLEIVRQYILESLQKLLRDELL